MPFKYKTTPGNLLSGQYFPNWRNGLRQQKQGTRRTKLLLIGDSTTYGSGSTGANPPSPGSTSWPSQFAALYNPVTPCSIGLSAPWGATDTRWAIAGWVTGAAAYGFASLGWIAGAPGVADATFTPAVSCDTFDIYYVQAGGLGSFSAAIDAAANTGVVRSTNGAAGVAKYTVAGAVGGGHVLHIGNVTLNSVAIVAVEAYNSVTPVVSVGNVGIPGTSAYQWSDNGGAVAPVGSLATLKAYAPDLTIVSLGGINDANLSVSLSNYQLAINTIVPAAQVSGDVLLVSAVPSRLAAPGNVTGYEALCATFLSTYSQNNNVGFLDLYNRNYPPAKFDGFGWYNDNFHYTTIGYADYAQAIYETILAIS